MLYNWCWDTQFQQFFVKNQWRTTSVAKWSSFSAKCYLWQSPRSLADKAHALAVGNATSICFPQASCENWLRIWDTGGQVIWHLKCACFMPCPSVSLAFNFRLQPQESTWNNPLPPIFLLPPENFLNKCDRLQLRDQRHGFTKFHSLQMFRCWTNGYSGYIQNRTSFNWLLSTKKASAVQTLWVRA